jgi:hypothetical protein
MRANEALKFFEPVALTNHGIIIRGMVNVNRTIYFKENGGTGVEVVSDSDSSTSKYQIVYASTGAVGNLRPKNIKQIDEYLASKEHFKQELFTL